MKIVNSYYQNTYAFVLKFLLLLIINSFVVCCVRKDTKQVLPSNSGKLFSAYAVDINAATAAELEKIPSIGAATAQNIIEHREKYGKFRRAEHLLLVRGISDKKFRQIRDLIKIE